MGRSQAGGGIGATVANLHHSHSDARICDLCRSSQQCRALNPLSEARDQTRVLVVTGQVRYHGATTGTPCSVLYAIKIEQ